LNSGKAIVALSVLVLCASCGPRMRNQISIQPYEQKMPIMPKGTVPVTGRLETASALESQSSKLSGSATPTTISDGRIYYGYYCAMCHGEKGDGNGPVGESYIPKPANLGSPTVAGMSDGQLLNSMIHGVGHDPVMNQTVLPAHRRPLIAYIRTFGKRSH